VVDRIFEECEIGAILGTGELTRSVSYIYAKRRRSILYHKIIPQDDIFSGWEDKSDCSRNPSMLCFASNKAAIKSPHSVGGHIGALVHPLR